MVADLQFWGQTTPVESFLEKLTQRYSVNAVLESAAFGGFATVSRELSAALTCHIGCLHLPCSCTIKHSTT